MYKETVVIQKTGSAPTSITDGTEIYRGTGTTVTATDLVRLEAYYFAVFTIDEAGSYRTPVVSEMYSYDFPDPPTSYSEIEKLYATEQWVAPEDGYFKFIGLAKSCNGNKGNRGSGASASGGSGGSGGIIASIFQLYAGETVSLTIADNVTISSDEETATATKGGDGSNGWIAFSGVSVTGAYGGSGGIAGTASGGNLANIAGRKGNNGDGSKHSNVPDTVASVSNSYDGYSTTSGQGTVTTTPGTGTPAYVVVLRGNTNVPAPSTVPTLSLTPRNASIEASWENSQDPESVGTIVVVNSDHEPTTPEDGTSVDVA